MNVVSLFSGIGGLDLGFKSAGHTIIWANDNDADTVETYKQNLGDHIVLSSIEDIKNKQIPDCDIIIGGFPCQGFSMANMNRNVEDNRNKLYREMLRIVKAKKPKFFLAENVKGILSLGKGAIIDMIVSDFTKIGYTVQYKLLNAADYGVPQLRERVIIVGVRNDVKNKFTFPEPTHHDPNKLPGCKGKPWITIGKALENIPEPGAACNLANHTFSKYKLRFNGYLGHRYVDPNKPAPTVTGRGDTRGGVVVMHHPSNKRRMSARELAITQSFPIDYKFAGCRSSVYRQIANAVPPLLAKAVANSIKV